MSDWMPTTEDVRGAWVQERNMTAFNVRVPEEWPREFDRWLQGIEADAWDEGQKSGLRYTDRMRAAYEIGRPELPGPPSRNPYRSEQ